MYLVFVPHMLTSKCVSSDTVCATHADLKVCVKWHSLFVPRMLISKCVSSDTVCLCHPCWPQSLCQVTLSVCVRNIHTRRPVRDKKTRRVLVMCNERFITSRRSARSLGAVMQVDNFRIIYEYSWYPAELSERIVGVGHSWSNVVWW